MDIFSGIIEYGEYMQAMQKGEQDKHEASNESSEYWEKSSFGYILAKSLFHMKPFGGYWFVFFEA